MIYTAIYTEVAAVLSIDHPYVIAIPPEGTDIMYSVLPKKDLDEIADSVFQAQQCFFTPFSKDHHLLPKVYKTNVYIYIYSAYRYITIHVALYTLIAQRHSGCLP